METDQFQNYSIEDAVVFVSRPTLRPLLRTTLRKVGVTNTSVPDTIDACIIELIKNERAILILDWTEDTKATAKILQAAQGKYSADTRPIFFIAAEIPPDLLGLSAEYNVTAVHSGEISATSIEEQLQKIIEAEQNVSSFRKQVVHIADFQAVGDWSGAYEQIIDLLDDSPGDPGLLGELVNNLIHQEKWAEALIHATELRKLHPHNVRGMHLFGRCKMKHGNYREACSVLKAANIINPFNADRLVDLGNALLNCDQVSEASKSFSAALELDEMNIGAREGSGKCLLITGDVNEALALLSNFSSPRELAAVFNDSAIISIRQGNFRDGLQLYKAAIKSLGSNRRIVAKLLFNMGVAYHKKSDPDLAYDMFRLSVEKDNGFDPALYNMQICARKIGRMEEFKRIASAIHNGGKFDRMGNDRLVDDFGDEFEDESLEIVS